MPCAIQEPRLVDTLTAAWFSAASVSPSDGTSPSDALLLSSLVAALPTTSLTNITRHLGPQLTSEDGLQRRRATALLAGLLEQLAPPNAATYLCEQQAVVAVLLDFFLDRFSDFPSLLPALRATSALLRVVEARPAFRPQAAVEVARVLFRELHVQAAEQATRQAVYQLLLYLATSPVHSASLTRPGKAVTAAKGKVKQEEGSEEEEEEEEEEKEEEEEEDNDDTEVSFALDFVSGFVSAMDGEKDPRCLVQCLALARQLLTPLPFGDATESLAQEVFEVTACYFPITFTPPPNDPHGITSEMLSAALCGVFSASPRLAPMVLPLLLEKLNSSLMDSKRAACAALVACGPVYGAEALLPSLVDIASSLRGEAVSGKERQQAMPPLGLPSQEAASAAPAVSPWLSGGEDRDRAAGQAPPAGYSLLPALPSLAHPSSPPQAPPTGARPPPPPPPSVADCALATIAATSRVLSLPAARAASASASASASSSPSPMQQHWNDWLGLLVRSSATEVERAPDSATGRASARVLCAVASASHHALGSVLAIVLPLCAEKHADALAHRRPSHTATVTALLAGLLNTVDSSVDHLPGQHPLHAHTSELQRIFCEVLDAQEEGLAATAAATATATAAATATATAPALQPCSQLQEARCLATAGLCDLCTRPPTPLLPEAALKAIVERLTSQALGAAPHARHAAVLALTSLAVAGRPALSALVEVAIARLLEAVQGAMAAGAAAGSSAGQEAEAGQRALTAVTHLACASNVALWQALLPALVGAFTARGSDGSLALRLLEGSSSAPHPMALAVLQCLALAVQRRMEGRDAAALDLLALGSSSAGPSPLAVLLGLAFNEPLLLAAPSVAQCLEQLLRCLCIGASDAVQDALREHLCCLLLGLPLPPTATGSSSSSLALPALPAALGQEGGLLARAASSPSASLPLLLSAISCSRRGAPLPHATALAQGLTRLALSGSSQSAAPSAQCLGTLLNRLEEGAAGGLAEEALGSVQRAWAAEGSASRPAAVLLCTWVLKGLSQRAHTRCTPFLAFLLDALLEGGSSGPRAALLAGVGEAQVAMQVAEGLGHIAADAPAYQAFSKEAGARCLGTFKQRMFASLTQRLASAQHKEQQPAAAEAAAETASMSAVPHSPTPAPLLLALCTVMTHLSPALILGQAQAIMGIVSQAIEMAAPAEGAAQPAEASPAALEGAARAQALLDSVRTSALRCLAMLLQHTPTTVAPHVLSLAPRLVRLAVLQPGREGCRPLVRASAVDCLGALVARMPFHQLHPVRPQVVLGLVPVLDDPNRAVRRRAGACRNAWML